MCGVCDPLHGVCVVYVRFMFGVCDQPLDPQGSAEEEPEAAPGEGPVENGKEDITGTTPATH